MATRLLLAAAAAFGVATAQYVALTAHGETKEFRIFDRSWVGSTDRAQTAAAVRAAANPAAAGPLRRLHRDTLEALPETSRFYVAVAPENQHFHGPTSVGATGSEKAGRQEYLYKCTTNGSCYTLLHFNTPGRENERATRSELATDPLDGGLNFTNVNHPQNKIYFWTSGRNIYFAHIDPRAGFHQVSWVHYTTLPANHTLLVPPRVAQPAAGPSARLPQRVAAVPPQAKGAGKGAGKASEPAAVRPVSWAAAASLATGEARETVALPAAEEAPETLLPEEAGAAAETRLPIAALPPRRKLGKNKISEYATTPTASGPPRQRRPWAMRPFVSLFGNLDDKFFVSEEEEETDADAGSNYSHQLSSASSTYSPPIWRSRLLPAAEATTAIPAPPAFAPPRAPRPAGSPPRSPAWLENKLVTVTPFDLRRAPPGLESWQEPATMGRSRRAPWAREA